jgi:hypothetical protein
MDQLTDEQRQQLIDNTGALIEAFDHLADEVANVKTDNERLTSALNQVRRVTKRQRIGIILLLVIAVTGGLLGWQSRNTANVAKAASMENRQTIIENCHQANVSRMNNINLWTYQTDKILAFAGPHPTPAELAARDDFLAHVHLVFKPRDCSKVAH